MTVSNLYPTTNPSITLDFAKTKKLSPLITFTRSSTGTYVDRNGVIQTAAINQPRFDHNPTTYQSLGLLVEEARTNSISNNTMVGAVAGTPGTLPTNWTLSQNAALTQQIVGVGVSGGVTYVDIRLSGTSSGSAVNINVESITSIVAANGQSWAFSLYLALVGGSTSNVAGIRLRAALYSSTPAYLGELVATPIDLTSSLSSVLTRQAATTGTISNASTAYVQPYIAITVGVGVAIDITLRIGLPQLEQGAFATSPILTSGAAATRAADVATITGTNFSRWYRQDEGSCYASGQGFTAAVRWAGFNSVASFSECIAFGNTVANNGELTVRTPSTTTAVSINSGTANVANTETRQAAAFAVNSFAVSKDGSSPAVAASGNLPNSRTTLYIGVSSNTFTYHNGTISRLTYWPRRLDNSVLQELSR